MADTPILGIHEIAPTQTDKTTTMNDAIVQLEGATQDNFAVVFTVNARTLSATEYTNHVCFVCGSLSGTGTLTVPLTKRLFVVDNSAGGSPAHDVTVQGATGASATVTAGTVSLLYCDGTDVKSFTASVVSTGAVTSFNTRTGAVTLTEADIANLDLSTLPTSDPGGGKVWINGGGGSPASGALWVGST